MKPEESYAWQPQERSEPESLPTSSFTYTPSPLGQGHTGSHMSQDSQSELSSKTVTDPYSSANGNIYNASPTVQSHQQAPTSQHRTQPHSEASRSSPWQHPTSSTGAATGKGDHHVSTSMVHLRDEPSRLPPSQSPYITLLQKNRGAYVEDALLFNATVT